MAEGHFFFLEKGKRVNFDLKEPFKDRGSILIIYTFFFKKTSQQEFDGWGPYFNSCGPCSNEYL